MIKFNTKRTVIMGLILIFIISGFGGFIYFQKQNEIRNEENSFSFIKKLIYALIEIKNSRESMLSDSSSTDAIFQFLEGSYSMREHLVSGRDGISPWINDTNLTIRSMASDMKEGMDKMIEASDSYIRISGGHSQNAKEDLAIMKVKLKSGRDKIMLVPAFYDTIASLTVSPEHKEWLIDYIETNFEDEEQERIRYIQGSGSEDFGLPEEFVAASFIKEYLKSQQAE